MFQPVRKVALAEILYNQYRNGDRNLYLNQLVDNFGLSSIKALATFAVLGP